jgi:predicted regulator of Ras-like GTPase activity (Roadblock/LC7/MglB family)
LTEAIQRRSGVQAVVILGADGLLIETHDTAQSRAEAIAARVPGVATATSQLGDAAGSGHAELSLIEFERGYGVVLRLSEQAMLFVSAGADVGLSDLLFDLRRHRSAMAALV